MREQGSHGRSRRSLKSSEQQTAIPQELTFVSSLPRELKPVFKDMLVNAVRICEASYGAIFHSERGEDGFIRCPERGEWWAAAMLGASTAFAEFWQRERRRLGPRIALGRAVGTAFSWVVETRRTVKDVTAELAYIEGESIYAPAADRKSFRAFLSVPIFKDNKLIYIFVIYRREARPFTDKQIKRAQDLAKQAVVAMQEIQRVQDRELLSDIRKWASPDAALETIKNYLNLKTTEGRAQKLLKKALKSGEVYFHRAPYVIIDENDLLKWLDRKFDEHKTSETEPHVPRLRDAKDIPRIEEARKLYARGNISKTAAAKEVLAPGITGPIPETLKTHINRLRKKL